MRIDVPAQLVRAAALSAAVGDALQNTTAGEDPWSHAEILDRANLYAEYIQEGR